MVPATDAVPADPGRIRLHLFAHAGAGAAVYRRWPDAIGPAAHVVPLPLPGREGRRRQGRLTGRPGLVADLLPAVLETARAGPYALYGHSLGALVAYTLTRALASCRAPAPLFLAVGACVPPDASAPLSGAADLPDERLLPLLERLGPLPSGTAAGPGGLWRRSVLPVLRDDLRLADALRAAAADPVTGGPVDVPVLVFAGSSDPMAPPRELEGWRRWSTAPVTVRTVTGGHFFSAGPDLPALLARACATHAAALPQ